MRRGDALVVAVVPFPNILGHLNPRLAVLALTERLTMGFPGQLVFVRKIEQLKRALRSASWRDIAVRLLVSISNGSYKTVHPGQANSHMGQFAGHNQTVVTDQSLARSQNPLLSVSCQGDVG